MFSVFVNAWKVKEIRHKIFFALLLIGIYRLGTAIPLPGVNLITWQYLRSQGTNQTLFSAIVGGGVGSIFAMGIGPYITSSIIMQLLTVAIPKLEQIQKEGEEGRKKINKYTRYLALVLSLLQGAGTVYSLSREGLFMYDNWLTYIMATIAMVTGTMFVVWLSELLNERAIGNGSSFIIFANILSGVPGAALNIYSTFMAEGFWPKLQVILLAVAFLGLIAFAILVQDGERRIPVQYSKKVVGRQMYGGQSSYIPIKVNIAGVMAIIFSLSILQFPAQIAGFFPGNQVLKFLTTYLDMNHYIGAIVYMVLIVCFTFFYTSFAVNPIEMAENMKKNGGFIPGIRPGKPTSDYIARTVHRLATIGSGFYVVLAMVPIVFQWIVGLPIGFGGTTLLIVTGVALEVVKQIESQLLMRHYKGFLSQ